MAHFLLSGYKVGCPIRVSRYNDAGVQAKSHGTLILIESTGAIAVCVITNLSWYKVLIAKNVTSLFTLLSVLCLGVYFVRM